jgi:hypothetical protein
MMMERQRLVRGRKSVDEFAGQRSTMSSVSATTQRKRSRFFPVAGDGSIRALKTRLVPRRITKLEAFRRVRDQIADQLRAFMADLDAF